MAKIGDFAYEADWFKPIESKIDTIWKDVESQMVSLDTTLRVYVGLDNYYMEFDAPGRVAEMFEIDVSGRNVNVSCDDPRSKDMGKQIHGAPRGKFSRLYVLPEEVNNEEVKATYRDGVLYLTLPRIVKKLKKSIKVTKE